MPTGSGTMADVYSAMALPGPEQTLSRKQGESQGSAKEVVSLQIVNMLGYHT